MGNYHSELEFENKRLEETIELAKDQILKARHRNEETKLAIIAAKKEMRENSSHSIGSLWSSEGFEALAELNQYANPVTDKIIDYEEVENKIEVLERLVKCPYFARIDFKFDEENTFEKIYIGRAPLKNDQSHDIYVYDWRSPVASLFYRFMKGEAYYDAPGGRITGEIGLKRQYEIENGKLEYFFDADVQIVDEFLRKLLSKNTSTKMKAIVETIQKEQDIVIRDMEKDLLMVQGVAGSGKTSIALHRAAYLMYQGLSDKLTAENIIIISPNSLFEQYISNVLPELGESNVVSAVFEELAAKILKRKRIQSRNQFLENLLTNPWNYRIIKSSIEFKTSRQFMEILNRFITDMPDGWGESGVTGLYKSLFADKEYFYGLAEGSTELNDLEDILEYTRENLNDTFLHYDDAIAITYLKLRLSGTNEYKNMRQVVIDEAQDYYPLQFVIFALLFPNAKYTVLGDMNQTLEKQEDLSMYEQIKNILNKKKSSLITMDKSFRCTNEILKFSMKFIGQNLDIKSFNRKGEELGIYESQTSREHDEKIIEEVGRCLEKGYQSTGLICKTEKNALDLFDRLKDRIDVRLIKNESVSDPKGVFIIPVYMSKGLEFDAVLLCDVDASNYSSEDDKKLLYIACTRALHRLNLFGGGKISPLLKPV